MLKVVPSPNQMLDDLVRDLARLKGLKFVHGLESAVPKAGNIEGVSYEECVNALYWACRQSGCMENAEFLKKIIDRGLLPFKKPTPATGLKGTLETQRASEIAPRAIQWLWPDRFAQGKLGLIGGLPDKGKGLFTCDFMACVTNNHPLPCNEGHTPQGSVILLTAEDDYADTVIPRLKAAGANLEKVHIVKMYNEGADKQRVFSLLTDLGALRSKIEEIPDTLCVIIDPMSAYLGVGKVNNNSTTDVRGFLKPLTDLAAEKMILVLGIMHFNKKVDVTNAMLRIADSLAYSAAARHVYAVVDDPDVENRPSVR